MSTIDKITGVELGGRVEHAGVGRVFAAAGEKGGERVVHVPHAMLPLLKRAGITPPPAGQLDLASVDAKLTHSGLDLADRLSVKNTLRKAGLL
jgi:hypothetical protein